MTIPGELSERLNTLVGKAFDSQGLKRVLKWDLNYDYDNILGNSETDRVYQLIETLSLDDRILELLASLKKRKQGASFQQRVQKLIDDLEILDKVDKTSLPPERVKKKPLKVVIKIVPGDGTDYRARAFLIIDNKVHPLWDKPKPGDESTGVFTAEPKDRNDLIINWIKAAAIRAAGFQVVILLPKELFGWSPNKWICKLGAQDLLMGHYIPVTIRSVERIEDHEYSDVSPLRLEKWNELSNGTQVLCTSRCRPDQIHELIHSSIGALAGNDPPEVNTLLSSGIPVALWNRDPGMTAREHIDVFTSGTVRSWPEALLTLRKVAKNDSLTLLYDDPTEDDLFKSAPLAIPTQT